MYLKYILQPHFLKGEKFTIHYPVSDEEEANRQRKHLLKKQGQKVTYSAFSLLNMKKRPVKVYRKLPADFAPRIIPDAKVTLSKRR